MNERIILLPGRGIILNADTIYISKSSPSKVISKLDTLNNYFKIFYGSGIADGVVLREDKKTNKKMYIDTSWNTVNCQIFYKQMIEFEFEGYSKDSMFLENIKIKYPLKAITGDGLTTGMNYLNIFDKYPKIEGSYNCGDRGWFFCYPDKGIRFQVKPYEENPYPEMFNKIIGFEIHQRQE